MNNKEGIKAIIILVIANIFWGSAYVVTKGATGSMPVYLLCGIRCFLGAVTIGLIAFKKLKEINRRTALEGILLGVLYMIGIACQTLGVKYTSAGRGAFLTSAYCIFMPFLEWLVLKVKPDFKKVVASVICLVGIGLVALTEGFAVDGGDIYSLVGSISFGIEIVLLSLFMRKDDGILLNFFILLTSGVISLVMSFTKETMPASFDTAAIMGALYLAVFCAGIPMMMQAYSQKRLSATLVTIILGFQAVFAAIFSAIFFKETFTFRCLCGFMLILGSVFISVLGPKKQ